jgi:hypothetical protein
MVLCASYEEWESYLYYHANFTSNELVNFTISIDHFGYYYFGMLNCEFAPVQFEGVFYATNPGGLHSSATYLPLPWLYRILAIVWTLILLLWIANYSVHIKVITLALCDAL